MLTWAERLTLWNQYEILKRINPDDTKEYETNQGILSNGYEQYYSEINPSIYAETTKREVSREVEEILNVFRAIKFSCLKLGYTPKSRYAEFEGFDGNEEGDQYGFAMFVRRTLGKWDELKDAPDNSHSNVLERYRRMLATWHRLGEKYELTEAEIEEMAESR
ncbi:YfbU family protein [Zavarzinia compransoris]|nr:YfbU family protein [Zavarzinia compransoris]TDP48782.1 hypothetical protein DES42_101139 [Zavarzinia compransoris]